MDNLHKTFFDEMPCYISIQDRDFRIVEANRRFRDSFGEVEGRYCYQVYKQRPDKCESCPVERSFRDGTQHTSEEQVTTLDGRQVSVIVYTTPIHNDKGEIEAVMEMSTDITEIKALQSQLRTSEARHRLLFEEVPCYISIQDEDLRIIEANRQHREAFGTYYGCKCYTVYKNRQTECDPCVVRQTFADGLIHEHEEVVRDREGRPINVIVTTAPLFGADGSIESVIEMSTDITQIRQLQSKLSSVGMIISSISHDLKGLLNGMDGGIYLVNSGLKKDDQQRVTTGWEMVLRNVDRVRSTVMDILYYARDREPDWQETRTRDIVGEVFELMKTKAADHNIEFTTEFHSADGSFEADAKAVRSMLVNLVDNSLDACRLDRSKEAHAVTIRATGLEEHVQLEVEDNGLGMTDDVRDKAFTLFFSSKGSGGTGLGLFVANKIAQSHGGSIELESKEGEGSRFKVILPRKRPPVKEEEPIETDMT
jgi:PAS domain S-box-containing protein